jgi:type IV pilus assembly protein PilP
MKECPNRRRSRLFCYAVSTAFLLFLVSCGGGTSPSSIPQKGKLPAAERKKAEATKVADKKEPEKKEEGAFVYDPAGKKDPFKPFFELTPVRGAARSTPLTPLQKYEISQLKLVAIISDPGGNIGLVEDSSGKGYFIKKDTGIGKNDGKVTKILNDRVMIEEVFQDILGQRKVNEIPLYLHRAEEGVEP